MTPGDLLGWRQLLDLLARFTATPYGRDAARLLTPSPALETVRAALGETRQARRAASGHGEPPWGSIPDIRSTLERAAPEGSVLDGPALRTALRTLEAAHALAIYGRRVAVDAPDLGRRAHELPTCPALAHQLAHDLDPDGRVRDQASPRLRAIRRQIHALRSGIQERLETLLRAPRLAPFLQERYVTVRNGRHVIPIRGDARRHVPGIVHDRSQSGATLFLEPAEVIDLNNRLTQHELDAEHETQRVLQGLTRAVRAHHGELTRLVATLATVDLAFARAALAERLCAAEPEVSDGGDLELRGARHPLLVAQRWTAGDPVVPVDLRIPAERPALLVTGPNAGGKTVALTTVGLLVMMAQAGLHLPVDAGSRLPVVDQVLAILGDEQNLARDLSTYSSFLSQARDILEAATPRSLVLLDELGAGTDPAEGAALGAALVEALLDRGARVIATTHLEPLKVFAETEPRCQNASVGLDPERLAPTYRLAYGHPGASYALALAERQGLDPEIVRRARTHLAEERQRLDALVLALAQRERDAEQRLGEARQRQADADQAADQARALLARARDEADRIRQGARDEARQLVTAARRRVGTELDELRAEARSQRQAQEAYHRLRAAEAELHPEPVAVPEGSPEVDEVVLRGLGLRGRIVARDAEGLTVRAGSLTVRVASDAVAPATARGRSTAWPRQPVGGAMPARSDVPRELFLLGATTDEARVQVEKFLDDAVLAGHDAVRLVHGKGTGALRRAVTACLRGHPLVSAFRAAEPREGGTGVTVVELGEAPRA